MSLKQAHKLKKELKACTKECDRLELENMKLRLDIERRTVEFMGQMQDFFGIVDSFFTEDDVKTLGEAKSMWYKFRDTLDETEDLDQALDAIDRVSIADPEMNATSLHNMWSKSK